jgi:acetyl-CoA C-acetyltransferase
MTDAIIVGWGHTKYGRFENKSIDNLILEATRETFEHAGVEPSSVAFRRAFDQAGITIKDLDFAEVHDCFTVAELLIYESMGLAAKGRARAAIDEGVVTREGKLPINLSGGLKAKGHPVGATGVSMHVLAAMQLANQAGAMQKPGTTLGCVFNMGGKAIANYCPVLEPVRVSE